MKRFLSIILSLVLLITITVPAFAATNDTESTEKRTVEDILNDYHKKCFDEERDKETRNPTAYSNRGKSADKTLEEETVDELKAAGYDAYHVTFSNYEAIENSLQTDFEEMGLDPNGSYIIAISGEENGPSKNANARGSDDPQPGLIDPGGEYFTYTYNGTTYTMRYFTVLPTDNELQTNHGTVTLLKNETITSAFLSKLENVLNTGILWAVDYVAQTPISTVGGALGLSIIDFTEVYDASFYVDAAANWTRTYTQIKNEYGTWTSFSSVDYVQTYFHYRGSYYDPDILNYKQYYNQYVVYKYSTHYMDYSWRKQQAAIGYELGSRYNEYVGDVYVYKKPLDSNSQIVLTLYQVRLG